MLLLVGYQRWVMPFILCNCCCPLHTMLVNCLFLDLSKSFEAVFTNSFLRAVIRGLMYSWWHINIQIQSGELNTVDLVTLFRFQNGAVVVSGGTFWSRVLPNIGLFLTSNVRVLLHIGSQDSSRTTSLLFMKMWSLFKILEIFVLWWKAKDIY